jgi:hypothetical protein
MASDQPTATRKRWRSSPKLGPLDDAADRTGVDVGEDKRVATMEDLERDRRGEDVMVGGGEVGIERAYGVEVRHRADRGALHSEDVAAIDRDVGNDRRCIVMTMQTRARGCTSPRSRK